MLAFAMMATIRCRANKVLAEPKRWLKIPAITSLSAGRGSFATGDLESREQFGSADDLGFEEIAEAAPHGCILPVDLMAFVFMDQLLCGHGRGQMAFNHGVFYIGADTGDASVVKEAGTQVFLDHRVYPIQGLSLSALRERAAGGDVLA